MRISKLVIVAPQNNKDHRSVQTWLRPVEQLVKDGVIGVSAPEIKIEAHPDSSRLWRLLSWPETPTVQNLGNEYFQSIGIPAELVTWDYQS